jgi:tripartite-type tricarboxylate transporter receptor subunit TctC
MRAIATALAALSLVASSALAQTFPSKPVRIVVGFGAGGGTDIAARAIAQKLTESFGSNFIVDNRPGAAGNLAGDIVARAPADGHTMLMANSTIAIPSLSAKPPFDIRKDFIPLSLVALGPSVLVVHPSLPVKDLKGLIALAKSKPGELSFGSGGIGNITHLAMELMLSQAAVRMVHIPYKGGAPSVVGLVSGEVATLFTSIPTALPMINAGKMRAIGVSISNRNPALPNVPTLAEAGLPGYYAASWYGLLLPSGVPKPVVDVLSKEIVAAMQVPAVRESMVRQGFEPVGNAPDEFARFIRDEIPRWERVVKAAGIKPEYDSANDRTHRDPRHRVVDAPETHLRQRHLRHRAGRQHHQQAGAGEGACRRRGGLRTDPPDQPRSLRRRHHAEHGRCDPRVLRAGDDRAVAVRQRVDQRDVRQPACRQPGRACGARHRAARCAGQGARPAGARSDRRLLPAAHPARMVGQHGRGRADGDRRVAARGAGIRHSRAVPEDGRPSRLAP